MGFVNEWVDDSDVEKYQLESHFKKIDRLDFFIKKHKKPELPGAKISWTVCRDKNMFLIPFKSGISVDAMVTWFLFVWQGESIVVRLGQKYRGEKRDLIIWEMIHMAFYSQEPGDYEKSKIIENLKEALTEFKVDGVLCDRPNYRVDFEF